MRTDLRARPAAPVDAERDPTRAAALRRLHSASAPDSPASAPPGAAPPAVTLPAAAHASPADPPPKIAQPALPVVPWAGADPDGVRPERLAPAEPDLAAWADPPWWRRIRWAPDRLAGAALVVLVVALGGFSVHRLVSAVPEGAPVPELPLATPGVTATAGQSVAPQATETNPPPPGDTTGGEAPVVVSVVGLVGRSGLVTLAPGARVADALDHAGGVLDGGDRDGLNLARKVVDGEQILVGVAPGPDGAGGPRSNIVGAESVGAVGGAAPAGAAPAPDAGGQAVGGAQGAAGLVNLNTADAAALDALPGVGPVTAASILAWRAANGSFGSVDQLAEVDGIGPATLARLRPLVTV